MGDVIPMVKPAVRRFVERTIDAARSDPNAALNERIISRLLGVPAQPATPESNADPRNPNRK